MEEKEFKLEGFEIRQAGSTTIEVGVEGISKSSSINYLATPGNLERALKQAGYTKGDRIDALEMHKLHEEQSRTYSALYLQKSIRRPKTIKGPSVTK